MADDFSWLSGDVIEAARRLLGCELLRTLPDGTLLRGRIIETEAYHQTDAASHSYKGRTPRTEVMFGPPGHLYVYFTYGMHYCCNVVTGPAGEGSAVLIRAVEPLEGIETMRLTRHGRPAAELTNGPGKVCQALAIDKACNGQDLSRPPVQLIARPPIAPGLVLATPRIGISQAKDKPWRFLIADPKKLTNTV